MLRSSARNAMVLIVLLLMFPALGASTGAPTALAATPSEGTLSADNPSVTWSGGPLAAVQAVYLTYCVAENPTCDYFTLHVNLPADYWATREGSVTATVRWANATDILEVHVWNENDPNAPRIDGQPAGDQTIKVDLGQITSGTYTVHVHAIIATGTTYTGEVTTVSQTLSQSQKDLINSETKSVVMDLLTVDYPVNIIFVGYQPTAAEIAEMKEWIPDNYKPTVAGKSGYVGVLGLGQSGLLNWNKDHYITEDPYFLGMKFNYKLRFVQASDDYAKALFQVAKDHTVRDYTFKTGGMGEDLARYDALYGQYRVLAKGNDLTYKVADPTKTDYIDAYAVEDWIFDTRYEARWNCAFKDLETNECLNPSIIQPDPTAYHDPYYDKHGLNLDRMPQGLNKGSSFFFLDTFTPSYAADYFRKNAYHHYGTDKPINGVIVDKPIEQGGSWRIYKPDNTEAWDGVDYARTWGGRYRFHFVDLGAGPNNFESVTWAGAERQLSSDWPHGDPPIWQYKADTVRWNQNPNDPPCNDPTLGVGALVEFAYTGNTPCRLMPRLGRDVAYGLFFRSTAGYLYRPIPRGDVYWLAVSTWTDFYSRPQWVNGQLTSAPWYGTWWTNTDKLYKINEVGNNDDDVLRWLSSAMPYTKWVGRKGEVIPIYDPTNNQPSGRVLDTSPKYEDLPAPEYKFQSGGTGATLVPEPLYGGQRVTVRYGDDTVDLTGVSNAIEVAKARGFNGFTYDDAVDHEYFRDYIDGHRPGIANQVTAQYGGLEFPVVNTIPSVNMVFEKAYTWALPAIVGGIAVGTEDGEAWGVFNNVNDRVKWDKSHYPPCPNGPPGSKCSTTDQSLPTQRTGSGFSYTIEHEAAHNLGLSHPHDGSFGVDRCPNDGSARAGKWECYWSGLGYMYDISAAPTTYAMSYRPYEVEDQDNLQRGHVVEYLISSQEVLAARVLNEAKAGLTTPSAGLLSDYERMKQWRAQAAALMKKGDYLHAEYAARNAALAMRGFPQTAANTSAPRLLEAGQVFYFTVNPQGDGSTPARPDLTITNIVASQARPKETVLTATVANIGTADAANVVVGFADGATGIGTTSAVSVPKGQSVQVALTWDTKHVKGERVIVGTADPSGVVAESNETNNQAQRTITLKGNKVTNGSFEQMGSGGAPEGWSGSQGTTYSSGAGASDGTHAAGATGNGGPASVLNPTWTSAPVAVTAGETYQVAMTVTTQGTRSAPRLQVRYLDAAGTVLNTVTAVTANVGATAVAQQVVGEITVPAGVSQVRLMLVAFDPTDVATSGSVYFDEVWMW